MRTCFGPRNHRTVQLMCELIVLLLRGPGQVHLSDDQGCIATLGENTDTDST